MENIEQPSHDQNNATLSVNHQDTYQPLEGILELTMNSILPEGEVCDLSSSDLYPGNPEVPAGWAPAVSTIDSPAATREYAQAPEAGLAVMEDHQGLSTPQASKVDREETTVPLHNVSDPFHTEYISYRLLTICHR